MFGLNFEGVRLILNV